VPEVQEDEDLRRPTFGNTDIAVDNQQLSNLNLYSVRSSQPLDDGIINIYKRSPSSSQFISSVVVEEDNSPKRTNQYSIAYSKMREVDAD
jgi:hypothetical protein